MAETNWVAGKGTTALGIIGTTLGGVAAAVGLGRGAMPVNGGVDSDNMPVSRYEAQQAARIAELETEVKLRDANAYTDQKSLALYQYIDGRLRGIEAQIAEQAVMNQKVAGSFELVRGDIARERDERCCGDNAIVNYANATFYPKMIADVTTGTTTTAQNLYNPLPNCGKCCGK